MANPMQRRAKNSFLLGFLLALIIMALVVAALIYKITQINEIKEELESKQIKVYVAASNLESGTELTSGVLVQQMVQTTVDTSNIINDSIFSITDEETGEMIKYKTKINIPAGSIITQDMIYQDGNGVSNDERLQEYNMISLPSQLKNGDYIDIRFMIPSGESYIVLSKKKVEATTANTVWIKVTEEEILTLNNAIVEAWTVTGSLLSATIYTEPGIQQKATETYPISAEIYEQIRNNPNVVNEAKNDLAKKYNDSQVNQRNNRINSVLQEYIEQRDSLVESGISEEVQKIQEKRNEYVTSLEGTGLIGFTE
ncbi:MAG: hypothetical protein ACI4UE_05370 [Candidatus Scatovivens sp.]